MLLLHQNVYKAHFFFLSTQPDASVVKKAVLLFATSINEEAKVVKTIVIQFVCTHMLESGLMIQLVLLIFINYFSTNHNQLFYMEV